ncbi:hypothetical protein [Pedobacter miscanthi]|uniref:Uncharacterized protein n=1 Tax=Pedobacter miscanthi TaxID=2259170 RepID=A0A366KUR9_9SPHI|nr:hypothetical protein [Pedobacter miscanthi]RBQ05377.1 hypothetical protein DRW42_16995 [Pedobacter miscanthi]
MKKIGILCFAMLLFGVVNANAQGALDRLLGKIDQASEKVDKAGSTADKAGKTGSKIGSLFGKKKDKNSVTAETQTTININGVDFATLKSIAEKAESTKGVASAKTKFSTGGSSIKVQHSGTSEDLLKALQRTNPTVFAEKNISGMEEGQISISIGIKK